MTKSLNGVSQLSDKELLEEVKVAAGREREATVHLIALLAQLDVRRLYLREGCSSLFTYCTQVLHLSEHAAYGTDRGRPSRATVSSHPGAADRRLGHAHRGHAAGPAPDGGQPS